jgi:hypothetical protein
MTGPAIPEQRRILRATAVALASAAVLLFAVVLPAEYGLDPLGTGRALGLLALANPPEPASAPSAPAGPAAATGLRTDEFRIALRPFDSVEYKYRLETQASLIYEWTASAPVEFEFHGEPDGTPARLAESYAKGSAADARGAFTAIKAGIHGWYWKNTTRGRVTVVLRTAGFYTRSITYYDGDRTERELTDRR